MFDEVDCSVLFCVELICKIRPEVRQSGKGCQWEFFQQIWLVMIF